jgi:hypothetical protein
MHPVAHTVVLGCGVLAILVAPGGPVRPSADRGAAGARGFLRATIGLGDRDLAALDRGHVITRALDAEESREIALAGVVRIEHRREALTDRLRDLVAFKRSPLVLQIGRFSEPPRPGDLDGLALDPADLDDLEDCRVGDCDVQLPAAFIQGLQSEVDWKRAGSGERVTALMRRWLLGYLEAYRREGNEALVEYADRRHPVRLVEEVRALIRGSTYLSSQAPELVRYLLEYPRGRLPGVEDAFYWSMEKFGFKPVLSVSHITLYTMPGTGGDLVMTSKQLYASHYFDASLGITAVLGIDGDRPAFYLLYLNRSRVDRLGGAFGGLVRVIAHRRTRDGLEKQLIAIKRSVEAERRE